jgi:hypothetical protein
MPRSFDGKTWVAFLDVSGFKEMMKVTPNADNALNKFYKTIFKAVIVANHNFPRAIFSSGRTSISSLVVSDCAVIFVDNQKAPIDINRDLYRLLSIVSSINRELVSAQVSPRLITTCAISYGQFKYVNRGQDLHTEKNFFYGDAYVKAYLGNEELNHSPGHCRIFEKEINIPSELANQFPFKVLKKNSDYHDFYWMLEDLQDLSVFELKYSYVSQEKYRQIGSLLSDPEDFPRPNEQ